MVKKEDVGENIEEMGIEEKMDIVGYITYPVLLMIIFYITEFKKYNLLDKVIYINSIITSFVILVKKKKITKYTRYFIHFHIFLTIFSRNLFLNLVVTYIIFSTIITRIKYKQCLLKHSNKPCNIKIPIIGELYNYLFVNNSSTGITFQYLIMFFIFFCKSLLIYNKYI
jgi:hypothetical protein